jgi:hypothetical protein
VDSFKPQPKKERRKKFSWQSTLWVGGFLQCSESCPLQIYSKRVYHEQGFSFASGMQWEGNVERSEHKAAGSFCMTIHLHIGHWRSETAQCDGFGASVMFPGPVTHDFFQLLLLTSVLNGQWFTNTQEVTAKARAALTDIEKRFLGMIPKALQTMAKVCHCPKELLWRKRWVNRCKIIYSV